MTPPCRRRSPAIAGAPARVAAACTLLLLLLATPARSAVERDVRVPGSARVVKLFAPSADAFAAPAGSRPLLLVLRGFNCAEQRGVALSPFLQRWGETHMSTGSSQALAPPSPSSRDDLASLAAAAADALDAVTATLIAPRSARACIKCATSLAAAAAAPRDDPEAQWVLQHVALTDNSTAAGADCPAWDATPACCQSERTPEGDVPFLLSAIDSLLAQAPAANRSRVLLLGFSSGAYMALRMACDAPAGRLAGVIAWAGADNANTSACAPPEPLPVLVMQGEKDLLTPFGGAPATGDAAAIPSAEETLAHWARRDRCDAATPPARTQLPGGGALGSAVDVVTYEQCAAPLVQGWFVRDWGHQPPRGATPLFLAALRRVLGRDD
jgi:hypothetical protein